ncbi:MAG: CapA family protein [Bacteroidales bacterium]|nr:CapA family protein [Bacteroidales bacterium]
MKVVFLGDVMPGGVLPYIDSFPIDKDVMAILSDSDLRIATLECAIGDNLTFDPEKMSGRGNIIYSPTDSADLICKMNLNVVSLANNHIFDLGLEGFESTLAFLRKNNILFTGAGRNISEATKPVIIEKGDVKIAIIAACSYDYSQVAYVPIASENGYGVASLDEKRICSQISDLKRECDYVVVLPHWGIEYSYYPLKESVKMAKKMINSGADLIVGSHTHLRQPTVAYKDKSIFFSLGNGLFPDFFVNAPRPIWYPDKTKVDVWKIPCTRDYPFPVLSPLRRVWKTESRIGLILTSEINKQSIKNKYKLLFLTEDNYLTLLNRRFIGLKLYLLGKFSLSPFYDEGNLIKFVKRGLRKIKRMIFK